MTFKNTKQIHDAQKKHRQQMRLERNMKRSYEKSLEKPPDVFTFLNNQLSRSNIWLKLNILTNFFLIFLRY